MIDFYITTEFDGGYCAADLQYALMSQFGLTWAETNKLKKCDKLLSTYKRMLMARKIGQSIKPYAKS